MLIKIQSTGVLLFIIKPILALVVIAFGFWGIGDVFRLMNKLPPVATVGKMQIEGPDFQRQYRNEVARVESMFGSRLEPEAARQLGLPERVVEQMVATLLFQTEADILGLSVPDAVVRQTIESDRAFFGPLGVFDRSRFQEVLQRNNFSEGQFVELMRRDTTRKQILQSVGIGAITPKILAASIHTYRGEKRTAQAMLLPTESVPVPPAPDEATVQAFFTEHQDRYQSPEYRGISFVTLAPSDLLAEITVSEDDVQAEYEARQGDFDTPERRDVEQVVFQVETAAQAAADKVKAGGAFADVAKQETGSAPVSLGTVDRQGVLPELADTVFGLPEGGVSEPVQSPLGWHLLHVLKIEAGTTASETEVKDKLREDLKQQKAVESMVAVANQFDDELGSGGTLEAAAQKLGLKITTALAVDASGHAPDGSEVVGVAGNARLIELIASTQAGETSPLSETPEGNYVIARVDTITPPGPRALDQVHDTVVVDWQGQERSRALADKAAKLLEKIAGGADPAAIAKESGIEWKSSQPFNRDGGDEAAGIDPDLAAKLFEAKVGDAVAAPTKGGYAIAILAEVRSADLAGDAEAAATLNKELTEAIVSDLIAEFTAALRKEIPVTVNQATIDGLL